MNDQILSLVEEAGFSLWMDEPWGPSGGGVDWSCNYDRELEQFAWLIIAKCVELCNEGNPTQMTSAGAASRIEGYFIHGRDCKEDI